MDSPGSSSKVVPLDEKKTSKMENGRVSHLFSKFLKKSGITGHFLVFSLYLCGYSMDSLGSSSKVVPLDEKKTSSCRSFLLSPL